MPGDDVHRCWVRHGRPEDGTLHVDKNGQTCAAGAGSIQTHNWHGFLHNGVLSGGRMSAVVAILTAAGAAVLDAARPPSSSG